MANKDQYVIMSVAQNLTDIANELKRVLGDSEIVQELFANLRLLYSTNTMTKTFNDTISSIVAGMDSDISVQDLNEDSDHSWAADNKEPAKSYNQLFHGRKDKTKK